MFNKVMACTMSFMEVTVFNIMEEKRKSGIATAKLSLW